MQPTRHLGIALVISSLFVLGACEDVSDKAERKYEKSVALVEEGDADRALVELRGVFDLNGEHLEARLLYANILREQGKLREAYGHYLLVTEQYPKEVRARMPLVEVFLEAGQWDKAEPHLNAIIETGADSPRIQAAILARDLIVAMEDDNTAALGNIATRAESLLEIDPTLDVARDVLVDSQLRQGNLYDALETLDAGLALDSSNSRRHEIRLRLLNQIGDKEGVGAQLQTMSETFPENERYKILLLQWLISNGDIQTAEDFLLAEIEKGGDATKPRVTFIQFLMQVKSIEDALAQTEVFIEEGTDETLFKMLRASTWFDMGRREEAVTEIETILADLPPSNEMRDHQITLARMYLGIGEDEKAAELVDTVLGQDAFHVEALKLRAQDLIEQDRVGDAILTLRSGLDQAPMDANIRTLMAKAHEREGNRDLMGENLGLAVQNSGARPTESLRYARFLMSEEKYQSARDIVLQSLRRHPTDIQLLRTLSEIYIGLADWPRTEQIIKVLRSLDDPQANLLANGLEATILQRLQRTDESLALLRGMLDDDSTALVAQAAIIRTHLANGEVEAARIFMDGVLADSPDDSGVRFLNAALLSVEGNLDGANDIYRELLDENPQQEVVWRALIAGLTRAGDQAGATLALEEALAALPDSRNLLWLHASTLEQNGDFEGAVEIYEVLYEQESDSAIVANNLASLISTRRDAEEDLQTAYRIARRLKGTQIPAFQDTYGWISYRLGRNDEALEYLAPAAASLTRDPLVQEHYAAALEADGQLALAREHYEKSLALLPDDQSDDRARLQAKLTQLGSPSEEQ